MTVIPFARPTTHTRTQQLALADSARLRRYRDALVAYLDAVYAGRDTAQTLAELLTEKPFKEWLEVGDLKPNRIQAKVVIGSETRPSSRPTAQP